MAHMHAILLPAQPLCMRCPASQASWELSAARVRRSLADNGESCFEGFLLVSAPREPQPAGMISMGIMGGGRSDHACRGMVGIDGRLSSSSVARCTMDALTSSLLARPSRTRSGRGTRRTP